MAQQGQDFQQRINEQQPVGPRQVYPGYNRGGGGGATATAVKGLANIAGMFLQDKQQSDLTALDEAVQEGSDKIYSEHADELKRLNAAGKQGKPLHTKTVSLYTRLIDEGYSADEVDAAFTRGGIKNPYEAKHAQVVADIQAEQKAYEARVTEATTYLKDNYLDITGSDEDRIKRADQHYANEAKLSDPVAFDSYLAENLPMNTLVELARSGSDNPKGVIGEMLKYQQNWEVTKQKLLADARNRPKAIADRRVAKIEDMDAAIKSITGLDSASLQEGMADWSKLQEQMDAAGLREELNRHSPVLAQMFFGFPEVRQTIASDVLVNELGKIGELKKNDFDLLTGKVSPENATDTQKRIDAAATAAKLDGITEALTGEEARSFVEKTIVHGETFAKDANISTVVDRFSRPSVAATVRNGTTEDGAGVDKIRMIFLQKARASLASLAETGGYGESWEIESGAEGLSVKHKSLNPINLVATKVAEGDVIELNKVLRTYVQEYGSVDPVLKDKTPKEAMEALFLHGSSLYGSPDPTRPTPASAIWDVIGPSKNWKEEVKANLSGEDTTPDITEAIADLVTGEETGPMEMKTPQVPSILQDEDFLSRMFKGATDEELDTVIAEGSNEKIVAFAKAEKESR